MVAFPNCKINLGLNVVDKRPDGYHNLETIFFPVQLQDVLEVIAGEATAFTSSGLQIAGDVTDNLCFKAYQLLKSDFPEMPSVKIHLHKCIPMGAGLGGGSADGAFTLTLLNKKFNLGLNIEQLAVYALQLGSDCPFFLLNQPAFATGRGEQLAPVSLDLSSYTLVLVNPGIHVPTRDAFASLKPQHPQQSLKDIIQQPVATWRQTIFNDFEKAVFSRHPLIGKVKDDLYAAGAAYASMTGTGSTVYGLFEKASVPSLSFPPHFMHVVLPL